MLAFDPREHVLDVVETANETRAEVETCSPVERSLPRGLLDDGQPGAKGIIDDRPKRTTTGPHHRVEPCRDVIIKRQRCPHALMLHS